MNYAYKCLLYKPIHFLPWFVLCAITRRNLGPFDNLLTSNMNDELPHQTFPWPPVGIKQQGVSK